MTNGMWAYWSIAAAVFGIGLASQARPRSMPLMVLACAVWPLSMAAVAAQLGYELYRRRTPDSVIGVGPLLADAQAQAATDTKRIY